MCCGRKPSKARRPKIRHLKPKVTAQALSTKIKTLLVCRPEYYGIQYQINPWMQMNNQVDRQKAMEQWNTLCDRLIEHGAQLEHVKPQPNLPDMVFTANAGIPLGTKTFVASNFKHSERKDEEQWFITWFGQNEYTIGYPSVEFEGAGDALFLGDTLICGHGFRSVPEAYEEIRGFFGNPFLLVHLKDDRFYHLDTCFCPLSKNDYLIFPSAFDSESLASIRSLGFQEFEVPEEEALRFACNAVCLGDKVVMPKDCPQTTTMLTEAGYTVVPVDMSEFLKSGGACKCLTLEIP